MSTVTWQTDPPTEPGLYEYRWLYGTPKMKHDWVRVEVIREGDELLVKDSRVEKPSKMTTYAGVEWRKAE